MAIEVIDKIKQKNNGKFALMDACDVELANGQRLEDKIKEMDVDKTDSLTAEGIAEANIMYFLGTVESISVGFPETANMGDMVFVSFTTGENVPELTITTNNHVGLSALILKANCYYELIGLWSGLEWVFVFHEVVKNE